MNKGKIVQVMGPVVDVVFEDGQLPDKMCIRDRDGSETLLSYGEVSVRRKSDQG